MHDWDSWLEPSNWAIEHQGLSYCGKSKWLCPESPTDSLPPTHYIEDYIVRKKITLLDKDAGSQLELGELKGRRYNNVLLNALQQPWLLYSFHF